MNVVRHILDQLALHLESYLKENLKKYGKTVSKDLYNSIHVEVAEFTNSFEIIGKSLFYGQFVERGRKAGGKRVPLNVLLQWVKARGLASGNKEISKIAWAVQTSIHKKGIKAAPFVSDTLKEQQAHIRTQLMMAFENIIQINVIDMVRKTNERIKATA